MLHALRPELTPTTTPAHDYPTTTPARSARSARRRRDACRSHTASLELEGGLLATTLCLWGSLTKAAAGSYSVGALVLGTLGCSLRQLSAALVARCLGILSAALHLRRLLLGARALLLLHAGTAHRVSAASCAPVEACSGCAWVCTKSRPNQAHNRELTRTFLLARSFFAACCAFSVLGSLFAGPFLPFLPPTLTPLPAAAGFLGAFFSALMTASVRDLVVFQ